MAIELRERHQPLLADERRRRHVARLARDAELVRRHRSDLVLRRQLEAPDRDVEARLDDLAHPRLAPAQGEDLAFSSFHTDRADRRWAGQEPPPRSWDCRGAPL